MFDVQKHVVYWLEGAAEELEVANELLADGRTRHGLFFLHLTIEKVMKAHVCQTTAAVPPKIHNLLRLSELAGLSMTQEDRDFLGELSLFNMEGRYPDTYGALPPDPDVQRIQQETERIYQWLRNQL